MQQVKQGFQVVLVPKVVQVLQVCVARLVQWEQLVLLGHRDSEVKWVSLAQQVRLAVRDNLAHLEVLDCQVSKVQQASWGNQERQELKVKLDNLVTSDRVERLVCQVKQVPLEQQAAQVFQDSKVPQVCKV